MAVKVTTGDPRNQSATVQHGDGADIDIRDGHLIVMSTMPAKRLAIYAPGSWTHAEVTK